VPKVTREDDAAYNRAKKRNDNTGILPVRAYISIEMYRDIKNFPQGMYQ
jgi:hypothetical protein